MTRASLTFVLLGVLALAGCGGGNNDGEDPPETGVTSGVPVEIIVVNTTDITDFVDATGTVNALYDADVSAETSGRVERILKDVGNRVSAGDVVIELDGTTQRLNLQQNEARLRMAEASRTKAERDLRRMEGLFKESDISESELEQARLIAEQAIGEYELAEAAYGLARKALNDTGIESPFDGEVTGVYAEIGEMVAPGQIVYTVVQADTVEIKADLSAADIGRVRKRLPVEIYSTAFPDTCFPGVVSAVAVKAGEATRTFPIEIVAENEDHLLKPGMLADVRIVTGNRQGVIAIPPDAVLERDGREVVFVERNGVAIEKEVEVSGEQSEQIMVLSGLIAGERLIVVGQHSLEDGRAVIVTD
jgi:RND family efflux transporter MFP subunit